VQPTREAPQLGLSLAELVASEAQDVDRLIAALELALGELEQVRHGHEPLLRTVVQIAPYAPALGIGGVDHTCSRAPQRGRLTATLELGRRLRGGAAHRGDVIVFGPHRPRVHDAHMAEVCAVGGSQADREVALETHVNRRLGLRKAPGQRLRERDDRLVHDERARLAARVVLEWLVDPVAVIPAADHPYVLAVGLGGLCDEGELRIERERDVTDQAAKELVADRTRCPLGDSAKQVPAAKARIGLVCVGERRHEPATRHRCYRAKRATAAQPRLPTKGVARTLGSQRALC